MDLEQAKARVRDEVDRRAELLVDVSHRIHAHPELCFEEHHAHDLLTEVLVGEGFDVERGAYGLPTAFAARAGSSGPTVAVICEYDALPGIGHACGHNIIAAAGLGAGLAAAALAEEAGGRVLVLGTPAEEGGGGKVPMIEAGALELVDAAMMVHGGPHDVRGFQVLAVQQLMATYTGRAAHAAAAPHEGRNALDAAVLGYVNAAALRQHLRPDERLHGVFTDGGDKPNVVPARAQAHWYVRAGTRERLDDLRDRLLACLDAGAVAAGCEVTYDYPAPRYDDMIDNEPLLDLYAANAAALGRRVLPLDDETTAMASTDMGNVSHVVPSIHPIIAVSEPGIPIHTPDFATHAGGPRGDAAVLDGAKAMAMTVADLWLDEEALRAVAAAFR